MRALLSHCDFIEYKPVRKETKNAEEATENKLYRYEEILVVFVSIESKDREEDVDKMSTEIETVSKRIGVNRVLVYPFAHLSNNLAKPEEAFRLTKLLIKKLEEKNFEVFHAPFGWAKELHIKVKGHPLAENLRVV